MTADRELDDDQLTQPFLIWQGTEPSHMHTRDDLNCSRGYEVCWLLQGPSNTPLPPPPLLPPAVAPVLLLLLLVLLASAVLQ